MLRPKKILIVLLAVSLVGLITACGTPLKSKPSTQSAQGDISVKQPAEEEKMPEEALFVCLYTTNQVAVLDLATGEIVKNIPVGAKPIALIKSPNNRYVYVANSGSGDVYMINTSSGTIDAKISMGNQPVALAINKAGDTLYALDYYFNRVSIIDLNLRSMTGFYELNTFGFEERIEAPDCCSDMFGEPLGAGRKPSALVLDEDQGKIYVGNLGTWDVAVIDIKEEKEVKAFDATFGINDMFLAGQGENLYISAAGNEIEINDFILKFNLKGGERIDKVKVGVKPVSMALSPDGRIIYVITQNDAKLTVLRATDGKVLTQFTVGGEPGEIVLSEDGSKAYVANLLDGNVIVVDTRTYTILDEIETGVTPKALVYIH